MLQSEAYMQRVKPDLGPGPSLASKLYKVALGQSLRQDPQESCLSVDGLSTWEQPGEAEVQPGFFRHSGVGGLVPIKDKP